METVVTIEVTCPACGDMFQTIFDASEEAARIAELEAENAELKAQLAQAETARNTWFDAYNQRGVTIDRLNEELEESIGDAAESAAIVAQPARIAELEAALRWLGEMADYAESNLDADWKAKNGADYRDALAQARAALGGAK